MRHEAYYILIFDAGFHAIALAKSLFFMVGSTNPEPKPKPIKLSNPEHPQYPRIPSRPVQPAPP